jgi:hypothetical protein
MSTLLGLLIQTQNQKIDSVNFETTEITQQVAQTARDFAQQHIKPYVMTWMKVRNFL